MPPTMPAAVSCGRSGPRTHLQVVVWHRLPARRSDAQVSTHLADHGGPSLHVLRSCVTACSTSRVSLSAPLLILLWRLRSPRDQKTAAAQQSRQHQASPAGIFIPSSAPQCGARRVPANPINRYGHNDIHIRGLCCRLPRRSISSLSVCSLHFYRRCRRFLDPG